MKEYEEKQKKVHEKSQRPAALWMKATNQIEKLRVQYPFDSWHRLKSKAMVIWRKEVSEEEKQKYQQQDKFNDKLNERI